MKHGVWTFAQRREVASAGSRIAAREDSPGRQPGVFSCLEAERRRRDTVTESAAPMGLDLSTTSVPRGGGAGAGCGGRRRPRRRGRGRGVIWARLLGPGGLVFGRTGGICSRGGPERGKKKKPRGASP